MADVGAVNQNPATFGVIEPQQQRHQRRLARPGCPDNPDLFTGANLQRHPVQPAGLPAIGKADILHPDLPGDARQFASPRRIDQSVGRCQGADAVLDLAQIAENPHQRKRHPAGHLRQPKADRARGRDIARRGVAMRPQPDRAADQGHRQNPGHAHQGKAKPRGDHAVTQRAGPEGAHRFQRRVILILGMGEQFHGFHIGDGIDDLPGHHGARRRPHRRGAADPFEETADEQDIARDPDDQQQRHPGIDRHQQGDRACDRGQTKGNCLYSAGNDISSGPRRLHLFLRDASGKVVVKERHRLADGPAMQP